MIFDTLGQLIYQSNFIINNLDEDRLIYNKILEPLEL